MESEETNEWSLPGSPGDLKLINGRLNFSIVAPAQLGPILTVSLPEKLKWSRLKDRTPEEGKYCRRGM